MPHALGDAVSRTAEVYRVFFRELVQHVCETASGLDALVTRLGELLDRRAELLGTDAQPPSSPEALSAPSVRVTDSEKRGVRKVECWGVRYLSVGGLVNIERRATKAEARQYLAKAREWGNDSAELVRLDPSSGQWLPAK